jgi:hypothetical protein
MDQICGFLVSEIMRGFPFRIKQVDFHLLEKHVGKRGNTSVFKSVFLAAKITSEFYKKSDLKNFLLLYFSNVPVLPNG